MPVSVLESFAAGAPALVSAHGGVGELVRSGPGASWTVEPGSVDAWTDALGKLEDGEWCNEGGRAARARYEEAFTPEANLAMLEDIYARVMSG